MPRCLIYFPKASRDKVPSAFGWWLTAAAANGFDAAIRYFEDFDGEDADMVIMRGYDKEVSLYYEQRGCRVANRWLPMSTCLDKWTTYKALTDAGIPTPHTINGVSALDYQHLAARLGDKFVVKQVDGSRGINVFLVSGSEQYTSALQACGPAAIAQQYIADSHGRDIRVWVIGGKVAGAVLRHSDTSFVSNYSQGGHVSTIALPQSAADMAVKASNALGLDFAGVDILFDHDSYTICEVNGNAGFRTLSAVSDIDLPDIFFKYLKEQ